MRMSKVADPVYAPNSKGGPAADPERYPYVERWDADGEFVHAAYTLRRDDDDWGQAGTLVREVMDDAQRIVSSPTCGTSQPRVTPPVLEQALEYCATSTRGSAIASPTASRPPRPGGKPLRAPRARLPVDDPVEVVFGLEIADQMSSTSSTCFVLR